MIENGWQDLTGSDKPTEEFLDQLLQYARWYGWRGDVNEIFEFIDVLRLEAGKEPLTNKEMILLPNDDPPEVDIPDEDNIDPDDDDEENN
jgi:hypothetical protein